MYTKFCALAFALSMAAEVEAQDYYGGYGDETGFTPAPAPTFIDDDTGAAYG